MPTATLSPLAQQLLDAQVQFFVLRSQEQLPQFIQAEVDDFFVKAQSSTLAQWLPKEVAMPLATYYLKDIPLSDDVEARIHQVAMRVYRHPRLDEVRWGDIVDEKELGELIDLALSLKSLHMVIRRVARNRLVIDAISDMMYRSTAGFVSQSTAKAEQMASSIPGAGSVFKLGKSVVGRATSGFEKSAEDNIKRYISGNITSIVKSSEKRLQQAIDDGRVKEALLQNWKHVANRPLASLKDYASEADIQQGIEGAGTFWREFRESPYLTTIIEYLSDTLYQYFEQTTVTELLEELGISNAFIAAELTRSLTPVLSHWHSLGWVEDFFIRQLTPFWEHASQSGWLENN